MFKTKICGITRLQDARRAFECGADAIGLNFYEKSKRFISPLDANFLIQDLKADILKVGVFVNSPLEEVQSTAQHLGLDCVQLHGDEDAEFASALSRKFIKAIRLPEFDDESTAKEKLNQVAAPYKNDPNLAGFLVDAHDPEHYGGTGKSLNWDHLNELELGVPLLLAGGLNATNVGKAIQTARPFGVDVASGVEQSPGIKDPELVQLFVRNAQNAFKN